MPEHRLEINEKSISTELQKYKDQPYSALSEYIWNAFDAKASTVDIKYVIPEAGMGYIENIEILDNGNGWDFDTRDTKYFMSSSKSEEKKNTKTLPHGKWGRGRYVFIWFAESLTSYSKNNKLILDKHLNVSKSNTETKFQAGTKIILNKLDNIFSECLKDAEELKKQLSLEFCWFLNENPRFRININGEELEFDSLIKKRLILCSADFSEELKSQLDEKITIEIILWNERPHEYAKFYFINQTNEQEVFTSYTSLNKQKDDYWHSVYIHSSLFKQSDIDSVDNENQLSLFDDSSSKIKFKLLREIRQKLVELRKPLLLEKSRVVISQLHTDKVMPKLDNFGIIDTQSFDDLLEQVFVIAPFLFIGKSKEDKTFLCSVLAGLLSSYDSNLITVILQQVQDLSLEEQDQLQEILQRTTLSNVVRTIKEIDYRLNVIGDLNNLVFNLEKYTLEVLHLQKILNANPWVFGEEFRLFKDTEGSLRKTLIEYAEKILKIDNPNIETTSRKELDLFLVKSIEERETIHRNIIVEIKRPKIIIAKKEFDQIEEYASTIMKEPVCNGDTMWWEFYLIGDDYGEYIQEKIESSSNLGERARGLVSYTKSGRSKVYVRKWSDILHSELGHKMKYLKEKLEINTTHNEENPDAIIEKYKN